MHKHHVFYRLQINPGTHYLLNFWAKLDKFDFFCWVFKSKFSNLHRIKNDLNQRQMQIAEKQTLTNPFVSCRHFLRVVITLIIIIVVSFSLKQSKMLLHKIEFLFSPIFFAFIFTSTKTVTWTITQQQQQHN